MLRILLKKMARNRWLFICLVAGSIIAVALVASIPLYTSATLQRLLTKDLESFQAQMGMFPGRYTLGAGFLAGPTGLGTGFPDYDRVVRTRIIPDLGLPVLAATNQITADFLQALPTVQREESPPMRYVKLEALQGAKDHLSVLQGRLFEAPPAGTGIGDREIEVVVTEQALVTNDLRVGELYTVTDTPGALKTPLHVRVVGVFAMKDPSDPWWFLTLRNYDSTMLTDYDFLRAAIADPPTGLLSQCYWSYALDYHVITVASLGKLLRTLEAQLRLFDQNQVTSDLPMLDIMRAYGGRERQLLSELWFLQIPILLMLAFYVSMVSRLIIDAERNEIAVLKSRGAGSGQIFAVYCAVSLIVAAIAVGAGPPLGLLICRMLGAANGFLEFVQRTGIQASLSGTAYLYGTLRALLMAVTMLFPAMRASRTTIVLHKQRRSRAEKSPFWQRMFLDLILLALAGYGYYGYRTQKSLLVLTGLNPGEMPMDPALFLISTLFVIGVGMLFLRLYPYLVRLVFRVGRKVWTPSVYAAFLGVGRSGGGEKFLMLFLIITLSIGILNAKTARTINRNIEDSIAYAGGADIALQEKWPSNLFEPGPGGASFGAEVPRGEVTAESGRTVEYREPDFGRFTSLTGIEKAAKVLRLTNAVVSMAGSPVPTLLMGIEPAEFAQVAAIRDGLLPTHVNEYLNQLIARRDGLLVSQSFADKHEIKLGDTLSLTWPGGGYLTGIVCAFVPFWPTYNPYTQERGEPAELVVANLAHVEVSTGVQPYEVWMKKAPGAVSADIYRQLEDQRISISFFSDASQKLVAAKNDALVQGTNGALTMGFVVTMIVSTIGFLIYWIISLQGRALQFGVFRAMGLSRVSVIAMVVWEQILVSLVAIVVGVVIGGAAADLFVPLLEVTRSAAQQVPPFRVVADPGDYVKLYAIVSVMLGAGLAVLGTRIARIRIAESIKLGEE